MTRDEDFDPFSEDEFWRAQNPGLSAGRGLITAVAVSAVFWGAVLALGWFLSR